MNSESEAQIALTLRIPDIDVDGPEGAFAEDLFDREQHVGLLCDVLAAAEPPAIVALNGEFGSGKSTFLGMCAAVMRDRRLTVVDIDAWQQRYTGDALVDLMGALSDATPDDRELMRRVLECASRITRNVAWRVIGDVSHDLIDSDIITNGRTAPTDEWQSFNQSRAELRDALASIAAKRGGRIIFLIDELDRCPPAYALDMLDRVRNVLDIPGVVVLYGITRSQLVNAVKQEQGAECDASAYLGRFFDREIQLRVPNRQGLSDLVRRHAQRLPYLAELLQARSARRWDQLPYCTAELLGGRLRDIQQFLCAADTVLWLSRNDDSVAALVVLTLKHIDRSAYDKFVSGTISGYDAAAALDLRHPILQRETAALIPWLQAQLILCSLGPRATTPTYDEFMERFVAAEAGSADDGDAVHKALQQLYGDADNMSTVTASLPYLVSLVEMSEPPV